MPKKTAITFGLSYASQEIILKNARIYDEILHHILKIKPSQVWLSDESDLFNLIDSIDFIKNLKNYYNIEITEEQFEKLKIKELIQLIICSKKNKKSFK
jgi:hypothetical protein